MLDKTHEWSVLINAFNEKIDKEFNYEYIVRGLTSFSIAQVGDDEEFW